MACEPGQITLLLRQMGRGDPDAESELFSCLYKELRRLAGHHMRREAAGHTLQPTALVHEVYVRLLGPERRQWQDRKHFLALASRAMRRILVDHARARRSAKRGGSFQRLTLDGQQVSGDSGIDELLAVHEVLDRLTALEPRQAQVVEMRYFGGFSVEETAEALEVSSKTVKRDWSLARIWLHKEITGAAP